MDAPRTFAEALAQWPQIQRDIALLRSLRNLRFVTAAGDTALQVSEGSQNAAADLRLIAANAQPANPSVPQVAASIVEPSSYFTAVERQFVFSIANDTLTPIPFDNAPSNTFGVWSNSNATRLTIPIDGVYMVAGWVSYMPNATGTRQTRIRANTSAGTLTFGLDIRSAVSSTDYAGASIVGIHTFKAGDYVDVQTYQNSGAALSIHDARIEITRLGPVVGLTSSGLNAETDAWKTAVATNGGTMASDSITIADALVGQLKAASFYPKLKYFAPLLGSNILASVVPLIDPGAKGNMTNTGFVDADFTQATGLKGNGSSKRMTIPFLPSQLGTSNNGGLGYWENQIDFTGTGPEPVGCYGNSGNSRFVFDLRSTLRSFRWGAPGNSAGDSTAGANGHYYGQRSSATSRELFLNGTSVASNSTSDAATGANERNMLLMAADENPGGIAYWKGRCAALYLTDGTLTAIEVSQLHSIVQNYLITPTGR